MEAGCDSHRENNGAIHVEQKPRLIIASLLLAAAGAASADSSAYVGLRAGSEMDSRFNHSTNVNADTPFGIYGGWNFNDNWGLELGYTDLGRSTAPGVADFGFDIDGKSLTGGLTYRHSVSEKCRSVRRRWTVRPERGRHGDHHRRPRLLSTTTTTVSTLKLAAVTTSTSGLHCARPTSGSILAALQPMTATAR